MIVVLNSCCVNWLTFLGYSTRWCSLCRIAIRET